MTIKMFLLNIFGGSKCMTKWQFCLYFENSRKDPVLRLQMRAKEDFNRHQLFSTNKQYIKIKLIQNETNRSSIVLVKTKYW